LDATYSKYILSSFLKNALDTTVIRSNDLWIYYFSLKSNFKANTNPLAVHLLYSVPEIPEKNVPVVLCNIAELSKLEVD